MHGMLKSMVLGEMKKHLDIGRIAEIWQSTLTMRASAAEYRSLYLRAHELLRDVPLYDVSSVDLPGGGSGRTIADIRRLESATPPSHIATFVYGLRYLLGRVFGGIENRCGRKIHFWNACRNATDATPK